MAKVYITLTDIKAAEKLQIVEKDGNFYMDSEVKLVEIKKEGTGLNKVSNYTLILDEKTLKSRLTDNEIKAGKILTVPEAKEKLTAIAKEMAEAKEPSTKKKVKK